MVTKSAQTKVTPALTEHERVGKALNLLSTALKPLVERELRAEYGEAWLERLDHGSLDDPQVLLSLLWSQWNPVFVESLPKSARSAVSWLRDARNKWARREPFSETDLNLTLFNATHLLNIIGASTAQIRELLRESPAPPVSPDPKRTTIAVRRAARVSGKYRPLHDHLIRVADRRVTMTFAEIERMLTAPLPPSARKYQEWWANQSYSSQAKAWMEAGFRAQVDLGPERVIFERSANRG